jgi:2-polyprenyl-6-methoxyphenol hydroxylase-like FAD-dependent oxidoreductase
LPKSVLISGAGIAGATLAWWLARSGFAVTVVERAGAARSSGNPVDVKGAALAAATAMGLDGKLRETATRVREILFVGADGRALARIGMEAFSTGDSIELPRGDLARLLYEAGRDDAEYLFGDQVTAVAEDQDGLDVRFESGAERRFDLLFGADGLHSQVRRLMFGGEAGFVRHMGLYVATFPLPGEGADPNAVLVHNRPGRAVSIHPARGEALCGLIFRQPEVIGFDYRDQARHRRILMEAYDGVGWRAPELIERAMTTSDLYFDSVSRVTLASWSRGRVALVGDAASCISLFGDGSSLAIAGARILGEELAAVPNHASAFARYEQRHRRAVDPGLRYAWLAAALIAPKTQAGIWARNAAVRCYSIASRWRRSGGG